MTVRRLILALLCCAAGALALSSAPAFAAAPETPETGTATVTSATTAALEDGVLNPHATGAVAPGEYEYLYRASEKECEGESAAPSPADIALGMPKESVAPPVKLTGLQPNAKYTFCLIEFNAAGTSLASTPGHFTTPPAPPTVVEGAASVSGVTSTTATLEAQVNPNNEATTYSFEYATNEALTGATTLPGAAPLTGYGTQIASVATGAVLAPGTTYYYRVVAKNGTAPTQDGAVSHFTTVPTPSTDPVTPFAGSTATLRGNLTLDSVDTKYFFEYHAGPECTGGSSTPTEDAGSGPGTAASESAAVSGLLPVTQYAVCFVTSNAYGSERGSPVTFTTTAEAPMVDEESVTNAAATSATLNAQLNPEGAETTYKFEYGTTASYGSQTPEVDAGSETSAQTVEAHVQGLAPDTTYHYRLVAHSVFGPGGSTIEGRDQTFTTEAGGGELMVADGRHWEMVSPPSKQGALIYPLGSEFFETLNVQASDNGNAIVFMTNTPPEVNPAGDGQAVDVFATRGEAGWSSQVITPPHPEGTGVSVGEGSEYPFFAEDLSLGFNHIFGHFDKLSPEATEATPYIRTLYEHGEVHTHCTTECFQPLVTASNTAPGTEFGGGIGCDGLCGPEFQGATPDLRHVVLDDQVPLLEGAPGYGLYEWEGGKLQLVSVLPEEEGGGPVGGALGGGRSQWQHAISDDGSRVVWGYESHQYEDNLYLRETTKGKPGEKGTTFRLDLPDSKTGTSVDPEFQAASADLSQTFFLDSGRLTANSVPGEPNLYEYNLNAPAGSRLTDLTPGEDASAVLGVNEDGSYIYYAAHGELFEDHDGTKTTIAAPGDSDDWDQLIGRTARMSPNGVWLTFMSSLDLTGYDTRDAVSGEPDEEVYLYNGETHKLVCASCNPTGARPVGHPIEPAAPADADQQFEGLWVSALVPPWSRYNLSVALYQSRYLSNNGRLFFDSDEALVPQDVNGTLDVYEYEPPGDGTCEASSVTFSGRSGGCVGLISSGTSAQESLFMDASATGGDVFFMTTAPLLPQDVDTAYDIYDAHECTSGEQCYATAPVPPPACETSESCKAAESPQPAIFGSPSSETFSGAGNITPAPEPPVAKRSLTRAQKLAKALGACRKKGKRTKRMVCERQARKRYGAKAVRRAKTSIRNGSAGTGR